jgi:hypothetical protein
MIDDPVVLAERLRLADAALEGLATVGRCQMVLAELGPDDPRRADWLALAEKGARLFHLAGDRLLALGAAPDVPSVGRH